MHQVDDNGDRVLKHFETIFQPMIDRLIKEHVKKFDRSFAPDRTETEIVEMVTATVAAGAAIAAIKTVKAVEGLNFYGWFNLVQERGDDA